MIYLSLKKGVPATGYWDHAFLTDILSDMPDSDRQIVIVPGAYQGDIIPQINEYLSQFKKVLVFVTSDEEGKFDCEKLSHPNMIHYSQYGNCKMGYHFPIGYTTETRPLLKKIGLQEKTIPFFYSGQVNSSERKGVVELIKKHEGAVIHETDGFAKGFPCKEYLSYMAKSFFCPAPGGHVSPDSFRFYEALEAGAIPILYPYYMEKLLPDMPNPKGYMSQRRTNHWFAWWMQQKWRLKNQIKRDLGVQETLTVVIPTSPIPSHPSLDIIDQTIASVRYHTMSDILITIDGVREEEEDKRGDYEEYIRRLLWKCNFEYKNVVPFLHSTHMHQSGMLKHVVPLIETPCLLYVEHDTPLVTDLEIDWKRIFGFLFSEGANVVRFHYEAEIPKEHEYLMIPEKRQPFFVATRQWSQRPHVARTSFYKKILDLFSEKANCFIEDRIYTKCVDGDPDIWKVFIYHPFGNIKRSLNLDGRAGGRKFDKKGEQIF